MKILLVLLIFLHTFCFGQEDILNYTENDFDNDNKITETIDYINSKTLEYNFKIDKQYVIKTLLSKIKFYENISDEILKEKNLDVKMGMIKTIALAEESISGAIGARIFSELENPDDAVQILKGSLRASRSFALRCIWEEYNHFLTTQLTNK